MALLARRTCAAKIPCTRFCSGSFCDPTPAHSAGIPARIWRECRDFRERYAKRCRVPRLNSGGHVVFHPLLERTMWLSIPATGGILRGSLWRTNACRDPSGGSSLRLSLRAIGCADANRDKTSTQNRRRNAKQLESLILAQSER
jgi:hypothetical protein